MNIFRDIEQFQASGYDPSSIADAVEWNTRWACFFASDIGPFLALGDPQELWMQGDAPRLDAASIARCVQESAPDSILFNYGLLPVWTSICGNVIAYHPETRAFYWADHERIFGNECVLLPTNDEELPLNAENLMKALIKFSDEECGAFLRNLRDEMYDAKIEALE